jgi:hypothetical protein
MHIPAAVQLGVMVDLLSAEQAEGPQAVLAAAGIQVPAELAQVRHVPHETVEQQVLSTQLPDAQSLPARQAAPSGFLLGGLQVMDMQLLPAAQSPALLQLVRQWPCLQAYAPQPVGVPNGWQVAAPSHLRSCSEIPSAAHTGAQLPSGSDCPAGIGLQVPTVPKRAQLSQVPQARLQQTPSAQKPLMHSEAWVQEAPAAFFPHWFIRHWLPAVHWLGSEQEL